MSKSDLRIDILGTSITISTEEDSEYLDLLLDKYRSAIENVRHKTGLKDPLKIAILTGFLLCDDHEKAKAAESASVSEPVELEQLTQGMIARLDEIIEYSSIQRPDAPQTGAVSEAVLEQISETGPEQMGEAANDPLREREEELPVSQASGPELPSSIIKVKSTVKNYDWGSQEWLPNFLGQRNISRIPWAELWIGVHPFDPDFLKLPFLFKVLAAEKPLSIQVHPDKQQALEGFEKENAAGIPANALKRNYKDSTHKHEILCALSPFVALCGFREQWEISALLEILIETLTGTVEDEKTLKPHLEALISALKAENPLKAFLEELYHLESDFFGTLTSSIKANMIKLKNDFPEYKSAWELCVYLAALYPKDPGVAAPLFLNTIELAPFQAVYIPSGVFHSYTKGLAIELMTCSDNVLRGGLSAKHVDTGEVLKVLNFSPYHPEIIPALDRDSLRHNYPAPTEDFFLSVIRGMGEVTSYHSPDPSILIITEGSAALGEEEMELSKGEAIFIPAGKKAELRGNFTAFAASTAPML